MLLCTGLPTQGRKDKCDVEFNGLVHIGMLPVGLGVPAGFTGWGCHFILFA